MSEFIMEEANWPSQSADLNLMHHKDELDQRLQPNPSSATSLQNITNALVEE